MTDKVEKTVMDYKKYTEVDLEPKLSQITKSIDDIFSRLEELQTVLRFNKQDRLETIVILSSLLENRSELTELFARIDSMENLVQHIKNVLSSFENELDKLEQENSSNKVSNLFTPLLFKRNPEMGSSSTRGSLDSFKTEDYFQNTEQGNI